MVQDFVKQGRPKTVAVDFDGVIHSYEKGWQDGKIYGTVNLHCVEILTKLREQGCKIVIFTTRAHDREVLGEFQPNQLQELKEWLAKYQVPYDIIHQEPGKPLCHVFIDDRAVRHTAWDKTYGELCEILNLEPT